MAAKAPTKLRATQVKTWTIPGLEEPVMQDPLSFFEKNELFGILADSIDVGIRSGLDLGAIVEMIGMDQDTVDRIRKGDANPKDLPDVASMASALLRVLTITPGVLEDAYLIFLSCPAVERPTYRLALRNMDDDTGFGILETFFEQNSKAVADFLPRWKALLTKAAAELKPMMPDSPVAT